MIRGVGQGVIEGVEIGQLAGDGPSDSSDLDLFGPSRRPLNAMHYLDWGVMRALGLDGTMRVVNEQGVDVTAEARENFPGGPVAFGSNGRR